MPFAHTPFFGALRRRWYVAGALVLIVAIAATVLLVRASSAAPAQQVVAARTGTLNRTVALNGTIAPANRADLSFSAGGQVTAVNVAVGQQVAPGQALATVDAASLPGQTAQARSSLASARARLAADRSTGASAAQIDADNAAVAAAQAQVDVAVQNEAQATLTAPFAGTVAAVNVTVGQRVSAGGGGSAAASAAGSGSGSAAAAALGGNTVASGSGASGSGASASSAAVVVVSTGSYRLDAGVDDTQVGQLAVGQAAAITPNGATAPIPGTVASVGLVATSTSGVASYPVTIAVTGSPPGLHLGASAQIEVTTQQIQDAVLVPAAAVHGAGTATAVTVLEQGRAVSRPVTVGASAGSRTQITKGLQAGEDVVVPEAAARPGAGGGGFAGFGNTRGGRTTAPPTPAPGGGGGS